MSAAETAPLPAPALAEIRAARERLRPHLLETPVHPWVGEGLTSILGSETRVLAKLELLQHSGSFKARGAVLNILSLDQDARARGVTAVSSGNHAIATAYAARQFRTSAKVVMLQSASPARVTLCAQLGAEVIMAPDGATAFEMAHQIVAQEGRSLLHPYDGVQTLLGTATLGLEFWQQAQQLDAVIIPIGGGGLCAGMSAAIKQSNPNCMIFGVEPIGADVMHRSFAARHPARSNGVQSIADSLGAPFTTATTYTLCRQYVDELVMVTDDQIRGAMALIFRELKLAVEPAAAAATAALTEILRERVRGLRVGIVICGTNIDFARYAGHMGAN